MSQEDLAGRMGTKQPAIARLETGRSNPRLDTLVKAAEALDAVVRVQFTPAEELGRGMLGRNWWDAEGASDRSPDVTFAVDLALTIVLAVPRSYDQFATTTQPFASFDATHPLPWPAANRSALPALMEREVSDGA